MTNDQLEKYIEITKANEKPSVDASKASIRKPADGKAYKNLDEWRRAVYG